MTTIFSRSTNCQELFSSLLVASSAVPVTLDVLMNFASGVDPSNIFQDQTRPPLTLILFNGRNCYYNDTDYTWRINIKQLSTGNLTVNNAIVNFSTDENSDPVFQYEWQYGDNAATGKYEAQVFGTYTDGREVVFAPLDLIVRPRI